MAPTADSLSIPMRADAGERPRVARRGVPIVATIIVLAAVVTMIALGIWQFNKVAPKERQIARFEQARAMNAEIAWPASQAGLAAAAFRVSTFDCREVLSEEARVGQSMAGQSGWGHFAQCRLPDGREARAALGWSQRPDATGWRGGVVRGTISPGGALFAFSPPAGLAQLKAPDPTDAMKTSPDGHRAYAAQWFFFAVTALVIYALALRRRIRA